MVLAYAVGHIPSIGHSALAPSFPSSDQEPTVVIVGHTNWGGAQAALVVMTNFPLQELGLSSNNIGSHCSFELTRSLVGGSPHPEILTRLIEESMSVQVNNVANVEPVRQAWAGVSAFHVRQPLIHYCLAHSSIHS